jgi:hypothetical protein
MLKVAYEFKLVTTDTRNNEWREVKYFANTFQLKSFLKSKRTLVTDPNLFLKLSIKRWDTKLNTYKCISTEYPPHSKYFVHILKQV